MVCTSVHDRNIPVVITHKEYGRGKPTAYHRMKWAGLLKMGV